MRLYFVISDFSDVPMMNEYKADFLLSYHYFKGKKIRVQVGDYLKQEGSEKVIVDSGAFSAANSGAVVSIDEYIQYLREIKPSCYAGFDVIGNAPATWENQVYMESRGLKPFPTFHAGEDFKYLKQMVEKYEFFALGGMVGARRNVLETWLDKCWSIIYPSKVRVHGFGLTAVYLMSKYPWYCMTEEDHQVLTKKGWRYYSEIKTGDSVLCFDKGISRWENIVDIFSYKAEDEELINLYNRNFSAKITPNHKWVVSNQNERGTNYKFKGTVDLLSTDCIDRAGEFEFTTNKTYTDEQVVLLAWYWTDGTIKKRKRYRTDSVVIYQSFTANKKNCDLIRDILIKSKEHYCECKPTKDGVIGFELYGDISHWLLNNFPDKRLDYKFIHLLTEEQAKLFLKHSVLADGSESNLVRTKGFTISVSKEEKKYNLEILRVLCLLLNIPTSVYFNKGVANLRNSSVDYIYVNNLTKEKIKYTGKIWCIQVPSKAFFVKSNDHIYVTGNSVDSASYKAVVMYGNVREWVNDFRSIKTMHMDQYIAENYPQYQDDTKKVRCIAVRHQLEQFIKIRDYITELHKTQDFSYLRRHLFG